MAVCLRQILLLVTIACVVVVFVAPSVDLPDITLAAWQNADSSLFGLALLIVTFVLTIMLSLGWQEFAYFPARATIPRRPWLCIFLC